MGRGKLANLRWRLGGLLLGKRCWFGQFNRLARRVWMRQQPSRHRSVCCEAASHSLTAAGGSDLKRNGLRGTVPTSIASLTALEYLCAHPPPHSTRSNRSIYSLCLWCAHSLCSRSPLYNLIVTLLRPPVRSGCAVPLYVAEALYHSMSLKPSCLGDRSLDYSQISGSLPELTRTPPSMCVVTLFSENICVAGPQCCP